MSIKALRDSLTYSTNIVGLPREAVQAAVAEVANLEAENAKLRAALEQVEWVEDEQVALKYCPWCRNWERDGHKPDCLRQLVLTHNGRQEDAE